MILYIFRTIKYSRSISYVIYMVYKYVLYYIYMLLLFRTVSKINDS